MTLPPATRLGPCEISAPLGGGGMSEVYRARDTRLERAVTIKIVTVDMLVARADEIGRIETVDNGKPIFESQFVDTHQPRSASNTSPVGRETSPAKRFRWVVVPLCFEVTCCA